MNAVEYIQALKIEYYLIEDSYHKNKIHLALDAFLVYKGMISIGEYYLPTTDNKRDYADVYDARFHWTMKNIIGGDIDYSLGYLLRSCSFCWAHTPAPSELSWHEIYQEIKQIRLETLIIPNTAEVKKRIKL